MDSKKVFSYYARIVMIIILAIEFILNIVFLVIISDIKDKNEFDDRDNSIIDDLVKYGGYYYFFYSDEIENLIFIEHFNAISAVFSLYLISFFCFIIEFIAYCSCKGDNDCSNGCEVLFQKLNHIIALITFFICQFLYFIDCLIIPVYFQRVCKIIKKDEYKDYDSMKAKYASLIIVAYVFLFIILFLDFIVLNLYKGICCKMEKICQNTQKCCKNFGLCLGDKLSCGNREDSDEQPKEKDFDSQIYDLNGEIKHLLAQNIEIRINKKINYNFS